MSREVVVDLRDLCARQDRTIVELTRLQERHNTTNREALKQRDEALAEVAKLRRLLDEALDYAEDAADERCDREEVVNAVERIRKEAGL